jgi:hypothetical protein
VLTLVAPFSLKRDTEIALIRSRVFIPNPP